MTDISPAQAAARENARTTSGQFGAQENTAPDVKLATAPECSLCFQPAAFRYGDILPEERTAKDPLFCQEHGQAAAANGEDMQPLPRPQDEGEVIVWLIEGDDHEYERVEAVTESQALDIAAERFAERYDVHDDEDEEDVFDREDARDLLVVAGTFRGDVDGYADELEFVPYGDIDEKKAFRKLEDAA